MPWENIQETKTPLTSVGRRLTAGRGDPESKFGKTFGFALFCQGLILFARFLPVFALFLPENGQKMGKNGQIRVVCFCLNYPEFGRFRSSCTCAVRHPLLTTDVLAAAHYRILTH